MENDHYDSEDESSSFCKILASRIPGVQNLMDEHLDDEDGALLPYVFMSRLANWAEISAEPHQDHVVSLVAILNDGLIEGEGDVPNLIAAGFAESLEKDIPLVPLLGGEVLSWYEFGYGLRDAAPGLRSGGYDTHLGAPGEK